MSTAVAPRRPSCTQAPVPTCPRKKVRTLVIGLGNPIVADDSVGLRVATLLPARLGNRDDVSVVRDCWGGLRLMEQMIGFDRAIVVDAACTGGAPGTIRVQPCEAADTQHSASAHDVDIATALRFGRRVGAALPKNEHVSFVSIEALDVTTFSDDCTPLVAAAIPIAVQTVVDLLPNPTV